MGSVDLIESPKQILCCFVNIVASRIIREVAIQWRSQKLLFENVDLVEEKDDTCSHKPSRVDHRVEE